jgi:AcrR family transcriptional regulator
MKSAARNEVRSADDRAARRGEAARQALLDAGIEVFGHRGLEGATTRDIARAAGQNIAAIPYYFGSKEGLYLAVADHLLDTTVLRNVPLLEAAEALLADAGARPAAVLRALLDLSGGLLLMFTREESLAVARILSREQIDPTAAFERFYDRAIGRAHRCLAGLLDRYAGFPPDPVASALRAHVLLGSMLGFRVASATMLRRTGWPRLGAEEIEQVVRVGSEHARMYACALREQARAQRAPAKRRAAREC